jgi:nicotinamide mononucleotide transporter PnuC
MNFIRKNVDLILVLGLFGLWAFGLKLYGIELSVFEAVPVVLNIIALCLMRRQVPYGFLFGASASTIFAAYFIRIGLYGQVVMRVFGVGVCLLSFYFWIRPGKKKTELLPSSLSTVQRAAVVLGLTLVVVICARGGAIAVLDYSALYLIGLGTIILSRKKSEAWVMYLAGDVIGLGLFALAGARRLIPQFFPHISALMVPPVLLVWLSARLILLLLVPVPLSFVLLR